MNTNPKAITVWIKLWTATVPWVWIDCMDLSMLLFGTALSSQPFSVSPRLQFMPVWFFPRNWKSVTFHVSISKVLQIVSVTFIVLCTVMCNQNHMLWNKFKVNLYHWQSSQQPLVVLGKRSKKLHLVVKCWLLVCMKRLCKKF